jgi:peptide/nickel transport system substrate-binding protein
MSVLMRYVEGRPALTKLMTKFAADAAEAGIEIRLEEVYGSILVAEDAPCVPGPDSPCLWELTCWNGGWIYHHPSGEIVFKTGAGGNFGNYTSAETDAIIDHALTSDDIEAFYQFQDHIAEQVPVIFTPNFPVRLFEVANNLRGFEPINPFGYINPENWYYVEDEEDAV